MRKLAYTSTTNFDINEFIAIMTLLQHGIPYKTFIILYNLISMGPIHISVMFHAGKWVSLGYFI